MPTEKENGNNNLTKLERKALIRKASRTINTQYKEAFKKISKN